MMAVYTLTLRQLTGRWRIIVMALLALLPVFVTFMALQSNRAPDVAEFEALVLNGMLAGSIIPLVMLAIAAPAFANEIEDRTLANLTLSSVPRWQIVVPKLLAAISVAAPFVLTSVLVTSSMAYLGDVTAVAAATFACLAAVLLYAAAFVFLGLVTTHTIALGLVYIVLWEGFFSRYVSGARLLSIRYHAIGLMHGLDERRFAGQQHPGLAVLLVASLAVFAVLVLLTIRRLRRIDVP